MNTKDKNRIQNGLIQRKKTLYHISMFSAQESSYRIRIKPQMKKKFPAKEFIWGLGKLFVARKRRIFSHVNTKKGRKRKKNQLELLPSNKIKQDSQLEWKYKTIYYNELTKKKHTIQTRQSNSLTWTEEMTQQEKYETGKDPFFHLKCFLLLLLPLVLQWC